MKNGLQHHNQVQIYVYSSSIKHKWQVDCRPAADSLDFLGDMEQYPSYFNKYQVKSQSSNIACIYGFFSFEFWLFSKDEEKSKLKWGYSFTTITLWRCSL